MATRTMPSEFFLNPLEIFVLALLGCLAFARWWAVLDRVSLRSAWVMMVAGISVVAYGIIVLYYIASPGVFDHGEIMVPAWSWMFASGHPLYNKIDDAARYSTLYGPDGTIFFAWTMQLLGPGLFDCKLAAGLAGIGSALLAWAVYAKRGDSARALVSAGLLCLVYLAFAFQTFMTKADPFLLLFAALALWAVMAMGPVPAGVMIALCLGVEVNLKVHGFLYILPVLLLYWQKSGFKATASVCAGAAVVAVLPFLHPRVSFSDWLSAVTIEGGEGIGRAETMANVQWFGFLWLPFASLFFIAQRCNPAAFAAIYAKHRTFLVTLFISMLATGFVGSKVASGPAHFTPFVPLLVYAFSLFLNKEIFAGKFEAKFPDRAARACLVAWLAAALFLAGHQQFRFLTAMGTINQNTEAIDADLTDVMKACQGKTVCMGYGSNQSFVLSQQLLPLVFAGQPLYFEFSAMQGFHDQGLSPKGRDVIAKKQVDVWLIPKGDQPFAIRSFYQPNPLMFDDAFRASFAANYQHAGSSRFFDLYGAKP